MARLTGGSLGSISDNVVYGSRRDEMHLTTPVCATLNVEPGRAARAGFLGGGAIVTSGAPGSAPDAELTGGQGKLSVIP